jgi:hypothetical protein
MMKTAKMTVCFGAAHSNAHIDSGKRNVVSNFTRVAIDGRDTLGGYPWLGGAVQALDPFNNEGRLNVPLTGVSRYLPMK